MSRRLARLTLDNLCDLPVGCQSCLFWELDPVRRERALAAGEGASEKEGWVSRVLLEWGSCGRVAYVDGDPAGYVLYAPASYLPGSHAFATAPVSEDAVLLATAMVYPDYAGGGLGRALMQAVAKDLVQRNGGHSTIRAIEAFGDTRNRRRRGSATYGGCVLPTDYLLGVGFKTHRAHPRNPRMRMELRSVISWRDEVEAALEKLLGVVRPPGVPGPAPTGRSTLR
ncbi:MAG TPA: GNAT family N-acetyltransferase [Nocardioidaceae bacterium]|nr:GNAT family N-acetyltransferase [Nocardioidaceae bacterium]